MFADSLPDASVDACAVHDLDIAAQRAGFEGCYRIARPTDGPTMIRFTSRRAFQDVADFGLIHIGNPHLITVGALETHVPVTFGHPYSWNAVATYPVQDLTPPCVCPEVAEVVHRLGCDAELNIDPCATCGQPIRPSQEVVAGHQPWTVVHAACDEPNRCPSCESPSPRLHPSTAPEGGEVYTICPDAFHGEPTKSAEYAEHHAVTFKDVVTVDPDLIDPGRGGARVPRQTPAQAELSGVLDRLEAKAGYVADQERFADAAERLKDWRPEVTPADDAAERLAHALLVAVAGFDTAELPVVKL
jgi:hypothetical protein